MTQRLQFILGVLALIVVGCSSSAEPAVSQPAVVATSTVAETLPTAPIGDLVEIAERTFSVPHRYEVFLDTQDGSGDIDPTRPLQIGLFDGTWLVADSFLGPSQPEPGSEPTMQAITSGGIGYFAAPGFREMDPAFLEQMRATNPMAAAIDSWVTLDLDQVQERTGIEDFTFSPNIGDVGGDIRDVLTEAVDVQEGPPSTVRGVVTRTFEAIIPAIPDDLFQREDVPVSFHVDGQGYLRLVMTESVLGLSRVEFFDFNNVDAVELPAPVIDITELSIEMFLQQQQAQPQGVVPTVVPTAVPTVAPTPLAIPSQGPTLLALIEFQPELSIFLSLLVESGIDELLDDPFGDPIIVLVPTNDGLEQLGDGLDVIRSDEAMLAEFVLLHLIVDGEGAAEMRTASGAASALAENTFVIVGEIQARNGTMHVISRPLG